MENQRHGDGQAVILVRRKKHGEHRGEENRNGKIRISHSARSSQKDGQKDRHTDVYKVIVFFHAIDQ